METITLTKQQLCLLVNVLCSIVDALDTLACSEDYRKEHIHEDIKNTQAAYEEFRKVFMDIIFDK